MSNHPEAILTRLAAGPASARQLADLAGISQPTLSRTLAAMGDAIVRFGAARSMRYTLRDRVRGLPDFAVYRVDAEGRIRKLGTLIPVRPEGFVMRQEDGVSLHSDGLPWWLFDMRPQGYLGRAYAMRYGAELGLPQRLTEWSDTHALRALLARGHDVSGNLLLGNDARDRFVAQPLPVAISMQKKPEAYARLAEQASRGELPESSAAGEQPKFTAFVETENGPRHVIVKFSEAEISPVSERWGDLLRAEHLALETLRTAGVQAATARLVIHANQRFLEVERFDRCGPLGRKALFSLTALDAEFVGLGHQGWVPVSQRLAAAGIITREAADQAALLWAFGSLIGNSDMHGGNLSFLGEQNPPYKLAPAYDMGPMAFAPRSGGGLPDRLPDAVITAGPNHEIWRQAATLAGDYLARICADTGFSPRFSACIAALAHHLEAANHKIARLG